MGQQTLSLEHLSKQLEIQSPQEIIVWAVDTFWPDIAMSCSFQTQSLPLLHIVSQVAPHMPIVFLDTGYHFPETLALRDRLVQGWDLNLRVVRASVPRDEFLRLHGDDLYRRDPDLCCYINKVEPMQRALKGLQAWISGIRRDQSPARACTRVLERAPQGVIRVHPIVTWTWQDIWRYIQEQNLPRHPLLDRGYLSIGCAPCTQPVCNGAMERTGRWVGQTKQECGLHTLLREAAGVPQSLGAMPTGEEKGEGSCD